jgi:hypothetical protein
MAERLLEIYPHWGGGGQRTLKRYTSPLFFRPLDLRRDLLLLMCVSDQVEIASFVLILFDVSSLFPLFS